MAVRAGRIVINLTAGTAQYVADMDAATRKNAEFGASASGMGARLNEVGGHAQRTGNAFSTMGSHGVTGVQATSGALRVLEGNVANNLRAAERFLATTLGFGPALQKIFPIVGGIATLGILEHLTTKAGQWHDAIVKSEAAPARIANEFDKLNSSSRLANDELAVTNDKLENEIAKLEGKPGNGLKLAIDEARVAADKLATSLHKGFEELAKLFKEEGIGEGLSSFKIVDRIKNLVLGTASALPIKESLLGETGFGGFRGQELAAKRAQDEELDRIDAAQTAGTFTEKEAIEQQKQARQRFRSEEERINRDIISARESDLKSQVAGEKDHKSELKRLGGFFEPSHERNIALDEGAIEGARQRLRDIHEETRNEQDEAKKGTLEKAVSSRSRTDPFGDEMKRLKAETQGVLAELDAVGKSESQKVLAKSTADALKEVEKLNKALREGEHPRPGLTDKQTDDLKFAIIARDANAAEKTFQESFVKGSAAIADRIRLEDLLTAAVGKGYEAQRAATTQGKLAQEIGPERFDDPEFRAAHAKEIQQRTAQLNAEYDAQHRKQIAEQVDKLSDQIQLEKSLASVQEQGAEALRLVTLAYKLKEIAQSSGLDKAKQLINAEVDLNNAQEASKSSAKIAALNQDIAGIERLTAAEVRGAEAVRQAQLQNRIEDIKRTVPQEFQGAEIQKVTDQAGAKRQQEITTEALKTGIAYQNHLESIGEEINALNRLKATQGDTLAIEISLHNLEKERAKVLSDQASVLGTARDGMRTFFQEMAADGKSAAEEVHTVLKGAFSSVNDELAKMVSGQKSNWASLFQGISSQLAKMSLERLESGIAAKLFPQHPAHSPIEAGLPQQNQGGWRGALAGIFGGGGKESPLGRNGQSPASALFVTSLGATLPPTGNPPTSIPFGGFRADGGGVDGGVAHVVGEEGPEIFVPTSDGTIIPHRKLMDLSAFNALQSNMHATDVSKPTHSQSWLSILSGALGGGGFKHTPKPQDPQQAPGGTAGFLLSKQTLPGVPPPHDALAPFGGRFGLAMLGGSALIGILSKIFGGPHNTHRVAGHPYATPDWNFGGFRAEGGPVDPGSAYMVGENEPELFTPPSSGRITPASKLAGNNIYYTIDARGTDPALTEQRVRASIVAAHNSSINKSFRAQEEHVKRTPQTGR